MKKAATCLSLCLTFSVAAVQAQVDHRDNNNTERDGVRVDQELGNTDVDDDLNERFATWDEDNAGFVDQTEFNKQFDQKYYDQWDANKDSRLSETEYNAGVDKYYGRVDDFGADRYKDWDMDEDGTIDINEFQSGMYKRYDRNKNGRIEQDELSVDNMNKNPTRSTKKQKYEQNQ